MNIATELRQGLGRLEECAKEIITILKGIQTKETNMTAAVLALQGAFNKFSTGVTTDLTAISTALGTLKNSQNLGPDDLSALSAIETGFNSIQSQADSLANPATIPAAPGSISLTPDGKGNVTLSFGPVTGALSYGINRGTVAGQEVPVGSSASSSFTDSGLAVGTQYFYTVTAINTAGTSPASTEASVTA